uniref:Uncharacterized protein n=1 Tax=Anguilla anguilla TaxID=7936 RepID=A0A0E9SCQ0_ANGAN
MRIWDRSADNRLLFHCINMGIWYTILQKQEMLIPPFFSCA